MSEKDLEQFNADVQENEAATAAPVDNASPEAIGEAIKEINGEADASAAPEKADDELQVGVIKPIATGKPESKRALKKAEKKKAKELKNIYHVSNWQIIKNYRKGMACFPFPYPVRSGIRNSLSYTLYAVYGNQTPDRNERPFGNVDTQGGYILQLR